MYKYIRNTFSSTISKQWFKANSHYHSLGFQMTSSHKARNHGIIQSSLCSNQYSWSFFPKTFHQSQLLMIWGFPYFLLWRMPLIIGFQFCQHCLDRAPEMLPSGAVLSTSVFDWMLQSNMLRFWFVLCCLHHTISKFIPIKRFRHLEISSLSWNHP